ncbi:sulfotransferase 1C2-like [Amphiura filiformis]|uniref:sulfotransferase 1C2-like n=1 Tax=Amphiura filiformis TaxID=82378 RepID=UPI003B21D9AB
MGPIGMMEVEGVPFPTPFMNMKTLDAMKTWEARRDDVFVVSYPKAGTTWTQEVVSTICHKGDLDEVNKNHTHFRIPFMEAPMFSSTDELKLPPTYEIIGKMKSPRTIKSHLPGHLLPPDIMKKKSRIVYVARNPKDVAVSYFYFHNMNPTLKSYPAWDEFLQDFNDGKVYSGTWWEHYLYFWNIRHESNVLFLKFEEMKRDLRGVVQKTADFLGYKLSSDVIDKITDHCTFENMKSNPMTNPDTLFKHVAAVIAASGENMSPPGHAGPPHGDNKFDASKNSFMRKGKVGDWRNHFTVAQNQAMDALIEDKLKGTGLKFE